jgi:hypothetical protein
MKIYDKERVLKKEKSGFLFFPKNIDGVTRWLEFAKWESRLHFDGGGFMGDWWQDERWLDFRPTKRAADSPKAGGKSAKRKVVKAKVIRPAKSG